jgi:hypothetical protein
MQAARGTWKNDDTLIEELGDWWTEEMELHEGATMEMNVATANEFLAERGLTMRVADCRDATDNLDWLVV